MTDKLKIKDFWEFYNSTCWKIKRSNMVDFYLYTPTMRYIYKTSIGNEWKGTKNPTPALLLPPKERGKIKNFKNEDEAVRWLGNIKKEN
jgi:hypothetical protein